MATFHCFEEIDCWQKARILTSEVYSMSGQQMFAKDFGLRDQIRRTSVSIMSNIAEGFERSGTREFRQFLAISKGSVGELKSQFYLALDQKYVSREAFDHLFKQASETGRMIGGLIIYLSKTNKKGSKYK